MRQFVLTPAAGKRLIAKALIAHPAIQTAFRSGTVVIIAGTTNGYVAEEILASIGQSEGFSRRRFFRGITLPPCQPTTEIGMLADQSGFPGDVLIVNGIWEKGKTIFDVADDLLTSCHLHRPSQGWHYWRSPTGCCGTPRSADPARGPGEASARRSE
jgi:hypothetical protein